MRLNLTVASMRYVLFLDRTFTPPKLGIVALLPKSKDSKSFVVRNMFKPVEYSVLFVVIAVVNVISASNTALYALYSSYCVPDIP